MTERFERKVKLYKRAYPENCVGKTDTEILSIVRNLQKEYKEFNKQFERLVSTY